MNGWKRIAGAAALLGLTGCVPIMSLNPFFSAGDVVFEAALLGRWIDEEGNWWTIREGSENRYDLIITPPFSDVDAYPRIELTLFRLNETYFLDFYPGEREDCEEPDLVCAASLFPLFPVHAVAQVGLVGNTLSFGFLDDEWVDRAIEKGRIDVKTVETDDDSLLAAPTDELRQMLIQAVADDGAFDGGEFILQR